LVPQYLPQLPEDTFSGEALLWNTSTQRLYSVGPDKKDHLGDFDPAHSQRSQKDWGIEYPWLAEKTSAKTTSNRLPPSVALANGNILNFHYVEYSPVNPPCQRLVSTLLFIIMKISSRNLACQLGTRLKERRRVLGMLQGDLAALAGISVHTLSNIESGKANPSLEVLEPLLDCLGLELTLVPRAESKSQTASAHPTERS